MGDRFTRQDSTYYEKALQRLQELENKIESAQIIELPCMVGRDVYVVKKDKYGMPRMRHLTLTSYKIGVGNFVTVYFASQKKYVCGGYPDIEQERDCSMLGLFDKFWFTDIKKAQAKLKELQGE